MTKESKAMSVDLQVLDNATAALIQSIQDMDGLASSMLGDDFTIHPAAFTLLDPGAGAAYANVRQYIVNFLANMEVRFSHMANDLQTVSQNYKQTDTGASGMLSAIGEQLNGDTRG